LRPLALGGLEPVADAGGGGHSPFAKAFLDALSGNKVSVGPPYFNSMFVPLTIPLAIMVGVGSMSRWKRDKISRFFP
jgi:cytochrome c biogenesis factor